MIAPRKNKTFNFAPAVTGWCVVTGITTRNNANHHGGGVILKNGVPGKDPIPSRLEDGNPWTNNGVSILVQLEDKPAFDATYGGAVAGGMDDDGDYNERNTPRIHGIIISVQQNSQKIWCHHNMTFVFRPLRYSPHTGRHTW